MFEAKQHFIESLDGKNRKQNFACKDIHICPSFQLTKDLVFSSVESYIESLKTIDIHDAQNRLSKDNRNLQNRLFKDNRNLIAFNNRNSSKVDKHLTFGYDASPEYQHIGNLETSVYALRNIDGKSLQSQRAILLKQTKKEIGSRRVSLKSL